jgi:glycosyltransferase involved in cell wall biosynthesis
VATNIPGNREIVLDGENGFLVPVRNPQAVAEALIKLIEDPGLRRRMGERGRQMVLESFTERQVFCQVLGLYGGLLKNSAARRADPGTGQPKAPAVRTAPPDESVTEIRKGSGRPKLLYLITEDWYFCGHRMDLARAARDNGYEVIVATRVSEHANEITNEGFRLIPIQMRRDSRNPLSELLAIADLIRIYRREKPDVVHHVGMKPIIYGSWASRFSGRNAVVNAFAGLGYVFTGIDRSRSSVSSVLRTLLRSACKSPSSMAVFQNLDDFRTLRACGVVTSRNSAIVQGNGVAEDKFAPTPEDPGDPVVLMASRLLNDKGVGEFVEAAAAIRRKGVRARFVLAGRHDHDNPTSTTEAQLRAWQAAGTIEYWGNRFDMPQVIARSHIVVLPSYREGFPKVLLEAASSGRPIVTTDVPGCREIVRHGENGLLVPVRDANALAEALMTLIGDRDLRLRMGARGREIVMNEFTIQRIAPQFMDVYSRAMRANGPV